MSKLTSFQQGLIDELTKEFIKINPKSSDSTVKRFTLDTIDECKKEEERFFTTIGKHNETMIKVFDKQFKDELKNFTKEFGKLFYTKIGYGTNHTHEVFLEKNKKDAKDDHKSYEMYLCIVSRTKKFDGDSRYNYCDGQNYKKICVDFKREKISHTLESGKIISAYKIVGLLFISTEYLYRDRDPSTTTITSTLDEYIQTCKELQKQMVAMSS